LIMDIHNTAMQASYASRFARCRSAKRKDMTRPELSVCIYHARADHDRWMLRMRWTWEHYTYVPDGGL